ncbi:hypothetical protein [Peribacillus simplex]|nr:hypothetical protein [Peribacillus simplex]
MDVFYTMGNNLGVSTEQYRANKIGGYITKIEVGWNIEIPFCYMGKAYLEEVNTKRKVFFRSVFRNLKYNRNEERI